MKEIRDPLFQVKAEIEENRRIGPELFLLALHVPAIAKAAYAGQFLEILPGADAALDPLLRRPISIYGIDRQAGIVRLIYKEVGKGTRLISQRKVGEFLDVFGPIGQGFILPDDARRILLVAGGIGMPPLHALAEQAKDREFILYYGARSSSEFIELDEWKSKGIDVRLATDDGSQGFAGRITDRLQQDHPENIDLCCACGPKPMLRALDNVLKNWTIPGLYSLEERMACGVGACLGCVCQTTQGYQRVCVDGPVFAATEVVWE